MDTNQPSIPDFLFKFVSVRPPQTASSNPNTFAGVLSRSQLNTASEAEIENFENTNGEFLYTQLQNAYDAETLPEELQQTFQSLASDFEQTDFFFFKDDSEYYEDYWEGVPSFWEAYYRSDKTATASEFSDMFLDIVGVSINDFVTNADFKEHKLRAWDNFLYVAIKYGNNTDVSESLLSQTQSMVCYAMLTLNTIEKVNNSSDDVDTPEKLLAQMTRPVIFDEWIGKVISYTKRPEEQVSDHSFDEVVRQSYRNKIADLYGVLSDLDDFELRELHSETTSSPDDNNYYGYNSNGNPAFAGLNSVPSNNASYGEDGTINLNENSIPQRSKLERFYDIASAKTQYLMKQLRLEAPNFDIGFTRVVINREITKTYSIFPLTPSTAGLTLRIGGNIISYDTTCMTDEKEEQNPCDVANEAVFPNKLNTGIFQSAGYGDLLLVEQNLIKYDLGEVAHIENILRGEKKTRRHERLDRIEETQTEETESTHETERETQSTERFSIEKETSSVIQQDMAFESGLNVSAEYGSVKLETNLGFSLSNSSTTSSQSASKYAKDVTSRARDLVIERVRKLRTITTIHEIKEFNEHVLDNTLVAPGTGINIQDNVSGVYRFVDKYYKCKIRNYGKRLMIEFIVPEPAAFLIYAKANNPAQKKHKPIDPRELNDKRYAVNNLTISSLDENNVWEWAKIYSVPDITPMPDRDIRISKNFSIPYDSDPDKDQVMTKNNENLFPKMDKYDAIWAFVRVSMSVGKKWAANAYIKIAGQHFKFWVYNANGAITDQMYPPYVSHTDNLAFWQSGSNQIYHYELEKGKTLVSAGKGISGDISVSLLSSNFSGDYNVTITYKLTPQAIREWQLDAFNKIMTAYQRQLSESEEWENAGSIGAGITIEGNDPAINRETEKTELKKHCLTIFTGERLEWFNAMKSRQLSFDYPEIDLTNLPKQAAYIQFFEQAFEWNNVTYRFYDYFWGRKAGWVVKSQMQDTDPIFAKFLQAGAARVVVPVRPGFEKAIATYMKTGKIWDGKPIPAPGTDLFVSIVTEQQADAGAGGFTYTGDEWELKVPTNLVYLQPMTPQPDPNLPGYNPVQFPLNFI